LVENIIFYVNKLYLNLANGELQKMKEESIFVSVKAIVHITVWLYRSAKTGEPIRIYATELSTSVIQNKKNRFFYSSMKILVDIISYFSSETNSKYNIFVNDIQYRRWFNNNFEPNEHESVQITVKLKER
jgi:hypothetical protein